jgi:hypothetical protein
MFREEVFMKNRCAECMLAISTVAFFAGLSPILTAQAEPGSGALVPYVSCQFSDGLQIVETDPLAPGITSREVDTDSGPRRIDMKAGVRVISTQTSRRSCCQPQIIRNSNSFCSITSSISRTATS